MKMKPCIRLAEIKDSHAIANIHVASWQKIYHGHIPNTILDYLSVEKREQQWRDLINKNTKIFVIEDDKHILGFASVCPARDADLDPKHVAEISAIYLHPNVWRQGLGKKLCAFVLAELQKMNFHDVILWVLEGNQQARLFYEGMGFIATGDRKIESVNTSAFMLNQPVRIKKSITLIEVRYHKLLSTIFFKPLQANDLDLLCAWLNKSHVKEWWDDRLSNAEIKTKYGERIGDSVVVPFLIFLDQKPIGFIQYYYANKIGEGWWIEETEGTIGIDQFIGEEEYINRGYGTRIIREFVKNLFENLNIRKVITDVDPYNHRAIRCYEKAGFKFVKKIMTPDGLANLMEIKRENQSA